MNVISPAGDTGELSASTTTAGAAITTNAATALLVTHAITGSIAFVVTGVGSQTATENHLPIAAYQPTLIGLGLGDTHVAAILDTGTGSVWVTPVNVS